HYLLTRRRNVNLATRGSGPEGTLIVGSRHADHVGKARGPHNETNVVAGRRNHEYSLLARGPDGVPQPKCRWPSHSNGNDLSGKFHMCRVVGSDVEDRACEVRWIEIHYGPVH